MAARTPLSLAIYLYVSSLFFAASAYAQLNDPDPFWWVSGYLLAGCAVPILVQFGTRFQSFVKLISIGNAATMSYFCYHVVPKLESVGNQNLKAFSWSFLELEEGREIVGLFLLFLHGLFLQSRYYGTRRHYYSTTLWTSLLATLPIAIAIYLWVYYQPEMNAKYQTEHCSGQFHDPVEGNSEL